MRIGELWGDFLKSNPAASRRLAAARIPQVWGEVTGPAVAAHTSSVEIVKGVLYVKMNSAAARSEIFMRREELKGALNEALGEKVINVVIVK